MEHIVFGDTGPANAAKDKPTPRMHNPLINLHNQRRDNENGRPQHLPLLPQIPVHPGHLLLPIRPKLFQTSKLK